MTARRCACSSWQARRARSPTRCRRHATCHRSRSSASRVSRRAAGRIARVMVSGPRCAGGSEHHARRSPGVGTLRQVRGRHGLAPPVGAIVATREGHVRDRCLRGAEPRRQARGRSRCTTGQRSKALGRVQWRVICRRHDCLFDSGLLPYAGCIRNFNACRAPLCR